MAEREYENLLIDRVGTEDGPLVRQAVTEFGLRIVARRHPIPRRFTCGCASTYCEHPVYRERSVAWADVAVITHAALDGDTASRTRLPRGL